MEHFLTRYRLKPGEILNESQCNSLGYLDGEFSEEKIPGVKRVVSIADSFACAMIPYKYHFTTKAEVLEGEGPKWEIYNIGVIAASPEEYLYLLKTEGLKYSPDLVLQCLFVENDIELHGQYLKDIFPEYYNAYPSRRPSGKRTIYLLEIPKRLYRLQKEGFLFSIPDPEEIERRRFFRPSTYERKGINDAVTPRPEAWWKDIDNEIPSYSRETITRSRYEFLGKANKADEVIYRAMISILKEERRISGGKFVVMLIPCDYQVDDEAYQEVLASYPDARNLDRYKAYDRIRELMRQEHIRYIDLLEPLIDGHKRYGRVYHLRDGHFNYWGNDVAAREIRKFLEDYFSEGEDP